ncbi:MAG: ADP-ribosylglycohydrolase family protein [Eubacteriales bacterium]|nr:ADP-ribosylglycohydrolase family protein [Eubacteriales bacterium]
MLGAIIGDIIGSRFEWAPIKSKDFELFTPACHFTDDSVMTVAVGAALLSASLKKPAEESSDSSLSPTGIDPLVLREIAIEKLQDFGRRYPNAGYGERFAAWLEAEQPEAYSSFGNGAAMRVSCCAKAAQSEVELLTFVRAVTEITHNHPEGIKAAEAVALAIYLAYQGADKAEIRSRIEADYYALDFTLDEIRPNYSFDVTCQGSVPQAIQAFLEAEDFTDAIRNAVSLGGDSDTQAAITGSIAEAYYGLSEDLRKTAMSYLDPYLISWILDFEARFHL